MQMKKFGKRQMITLAVAFLATVGVLFGGQALNSKFRVDDPLQHEVMAIRGVQHFKLVPDKDNVRVELKLGKVSNLETILDRINDKVLHYHGKPVTDFQIVSRSDSQLEQARYQLSFYLEEAAVSGRYIQLKDALDAMKGINARVYLGQDFIYIQLEQGSHYFYQAVPRQARTISIDNQTGGGSTG